MKRDPHSKAIIFSIDPNKKTLREQKAKTAHQSDEIQFLADCINYQQEIINKQSKILEDITGSSGTQGTSGSSSTSASN